MGLLLPLKIVCHLLQLPPGFLQLVLALLQAPLKLPLGQLALAPRPFKDIVD